MGWAIVSRGRREHLGSQFDRYLLLTVCLPHHLTEDVDDVVNLPLVEARLATRLSRGPPPPERGNGTRQTSRGPSPLRCRLGACHSRGASSGRPGDTNMLSTRGAKQRPPKHLWDKHACVWKRFGGGTLLLLRHARRERVGHGGRCGKGPQDTRRHDDQDTGHTLAEVTRGCGQTCPN